MGEVFDEMFMGYWSLMEDEWDIEIFNCDFFKENSWDIEYDWNLW